MPIIQLNLAKGRTVEERAAAMAAITDAVVRTLAVRPEQVRIQINEVSPENFSIGGKTVFLQPATKPGTSGRG